MSLKNQLTIVRSAVDTVQAQITELAAREATHIGYGGPQALAQRVAGWQAQLNGVHAQLGVLAHGRGATGVTRKALTGAYRSLVEAGRYPEARGFCGFFHERYDQITADLDKAIYYG